MSDASPATTSNAPRGMSNVAWRVIALVVFAAIVVRRPLAYGATFGDVAAFSAYWALYVVVPGWLVYRLIRSKRDDWLFELGMGWALGLALQAFAFVALKALHADAWFAWYPLVFVPFAALLIRRGTDRTTTDDVQPTLNLTHIGLFLALVAIAVQRQRLYPLNALHWLPGVDFLFHAGNAAEFDHSWPLFDPRFAGEALHYHFFSYAFPVGASRVAHLAVRDAMGSFTASAITALLALQVFNASRLFGRSIAAGLVAAAIVMFHADVLDEIGRVFGAASSWGANSYLDNGIYFSITTSNGLVFFTTIAIVLQRWLGVEQLPKRSAIPLLFAFGMMASGVKGSVMPIVLGGLGALVLFELAIERRFDIRVLGALVVLTLGALPMTLFLTVGDTSYAPAMFHVAPAMAMLQSGFFAGVSSLFGVDPSSASVAWIAILVPIWIVMYLGIAGLGACLSLRSNRGPMDESERWIWSCVALGMTLAIALGSPGLSQLFFPYNGQVGLAILAAAPIVAVCRTRKIAIAAVLVLFAAPLVLGTARDVSGQLRRDSIANVRETPSMIAFREALDWLRTKSDKDAIVVRRQAGILVSVYGERRAFNETARFTPLVLADEWRNSGGAAKTATEPTPLELERAAIVESFFAKPDTATADRLLTLIGRDVPVYVLVDNVREIRAPELLNHFAVSDLRGDPWPQTPSFLESVFSNSAAHIYRLDRTR